MAVHELLTLTLIELCEPLRARAGLARRADAGGAGAHRRDQPRPERRVLAARSRRLSRRRARRRGAHRARRGAAARGHPARREGARARPRACRRPRRRRCSRERVASATTRSRSARLKAAGAIVVGKTNAPEFGAPAYTKNRIYGVTRSPWNLELTPGRVERRLVGGDGRGACCRWSPPATAAARSASRRASPAASA